MSAAAISPPGARPASGMLAAFEAVVMPDLAGKIALDLHLVRELLIRQLLVRELLVREELVGALLVRELLLIAHGDPRRGAGHAIQGKGRDERRGKGQRSVFRYEYPATGVNGRKTLTMLILWHRAPYVVFAVIGICPAGFPGERLSSCLRRQRTLSMSLLSRPRPPVMAWPCAALFSLRPHSMISTLRC